MLECLLSGGVALEAAVQLLSLHLTHRHHWAPVQKRAMEQAGPLPLKTGTNVLSQGGAASLPFSSQGQLLRTVPFLLEPPNLGLESAAMLPTVRCLYARGGPRADVFLHC